MYPRLNQATQDLSVVWVNAGTVLIYGWVKPRQAQEPMLGVHSAETKRF
jgi:hypothetical protein